MKKSIALVWLMIFSSSFAPAKAQNINFVDENFLEYILLYTNIDTNKDGEIQMTEAEEYTGGFIFTGNIKDVPEVKYFKNLSSLVINGSKVTTVDITGNKEINKISINNSLLTTLDLSQNSKLTMVDISKSASLKEITFGSHPQLSLISLMFNAIEALDVTRCPMLTNLYFASNNVSSIDVTKNPRLTELNIAANKISSIDLSNNSRLTYLNVGLNKLQQINVSKNALLDTFLIQANPIKTVDISKQLYLRQFIMDSTLITDIDLSNHPMLQYFYANQSQLTVIDASKNGELIYLNAVSNNKMKFINVKNSNNRNAVGFFAINSPNLKCIQVDDVAYSSSQTLWQKDPTATFATDCSSILANHEIENQAKTIFYPNPTSGYLFLNTDIKEAVIYNLAGQKVASYRNTKLVDISHLSAGTYIINFTDETGKISAQKVIKN